MARKTKKIIDLDDYAAEFNRRLAIAGEVIHRQRGDQTVMHCVDLCEAMADAILRNGYAEEVRARMTCATVEKSAILGWAETQQHNRSSLVALLEPPSQSEVNTAELVA